MADELTPEREAEIRKWSESGQFFQIGRDCRAEIDRLRIQAREQAAEIERQRLKLEGRSRCEGCGLTTIREDEYTRIHVLNGVLCLCKQCLFDVNRKNPELIALKQHADALAAGLAELVDAVLRAGWHRATIEEARALLATHRTRAGQESQ